MNARPHTILHNGRITTMGDGSDVPATVEALAIHRSSVLAVGSSDEIRGLADSTTIEVDLGGRTVIPGLIDNHLHFVRAGQTWTRELRWERCPDLATALEMIKDATRRVPSGTWIRVVGGWHELQFPEGRGPSIQELDEVAPKHPVFVQFLYDWARVNARGREAIGLTRDAVDDMGEDFFVRDDAGNPTGEVVSMKGCSWLYAQLPVPGLEEQIASTAALSRDLSRFGVTSIIDGGGVNTGPDVYEAVYEADRRGELSVRAFLAVHASSPGAEAEEIAGYLRYVKPRHGSPMLSVVAIGEVLIYQLHDKINRPPSFPTTLVSDLESVLRSAAEHSWSIQMHMHQSETVDLFLDICEQITSGVPIEPLRWAIIHGEFITRSQIPRMKELGISFMSQSLLRFLGQQAVDYAGLARTTDSPPLRAILDAGIPVSAGTDAMRGASFDPFTSLHFYLTGRMVGGKRVVAEENLLDRMEALRLYTVGSAWQAFAEKYVGQLRPGYQADMAVLSDDYFSVEMNTILEIESELTMVGGGAVHIGEGFSKSQELERA